MNNIFRSFILRHTSSPSRVESCWRLIRPGCPVLPSPLEEAQPLLAAARNACPVSIMQVVQQI